MSCPHCANLQPPEAQNAPARTRILRLVTIGALKTSPCRECQLIWKALRSSTSHVDDEHFVEVLMARGQPLRIKYTSHSAHAVHLELFTRESIEVEHDKDASAPCVGPAKEVAEYSGSDECLSLAASWLKDCMKNHPNCQVEPNAPLPTRVIDVGEAATREPYLFETSGLTGEPYVALSYCWGYWENHPPMKTVRKDVPQLKLKANYEAHKQAIKYTDMPKTIQDAVTICRRLGVRYLWVDSLCIIQHDQEEWERECGNMCQVYSCAALTISATHSDGCTRGIFATQEFGRQTKYLGELADGRPVYLRPNIAKFHNACDPGQLSRVPSSPYGASSGLGREPLACRAWCLQESVLSNRLLHYTMDELVWECNTHQRCECDSEAYSGPVDLDDNRNVLLRRPDLMGPSFRDPAILWRFMWSQWVHIFTRRSISYPEDKLPALSGLAAQFAAVLYHCLGRTPRYLAGLWNGAMLPRGLCWSVAIDAQAWATMQNDFNSEYQPRRSATWRAPTWSFMSLDAPIQPHMTFGFESAVQILEASAEPVHREADPFGGILRESARLFLRGRIIKDLELEYSGRDFHLDHEEQRYDRVLFQLREGQENSLEFLADAPDELQRGRSWGYCLLFVGYSIIGLTDREPNFLVLRPATSPDQKVPAPLINCFERIGLANIRALPSFGLGVTELKSGWAEDPTRGEVEDIILV